MANRTVESERDEWQTTIADMVSIAFGEQFKAGKKLSEGDLVSIITTCINISNKFNKAKSINYNDIKKELVKQLGRWQEEKIYPEYDFEDPDEALMAVLLEMGNISL